MIRVWLDTDIGSDIDDAVALLLAARHPQIELVGVSTVFGRVEVRAWLARELLARAEVAAPILPGAVGPLAGEPISGELTSYLCLAPGLPVVSPEDDDGRVETLAAEMAAVGKPFHMVTIGALTNAARLWQRRPEVTRQWHSLTCMAGRLEGTAEWNVQCDPVAAKIVVDRLHPRLVGLEASSNTLPKVEVEGLLDRTDPASAFLLECYRAYRNSAPWVSGENNAPLTLFDPISLLSLVCPEAFDFQSVRVMVESDGRLRLTDDGSQVEYALSSDWSVLKPVIVGLLRGDKA